MALFAPRASVDPRSMPPSPRSRAVAASRRCDAHLTVRLAIRPSAPVTAGRALPENDPTSDVLLSPHRHRRFPLQRSDSCVGRVGLGCPRLNHPARFTCWARTAPRTRLSAITLHDPGRLPPYLDAACSRAAALTIHALRVVNASRVARAPVRPRSCRRSRQRCAASFGLAHVRRLALRLAEVA